MNTEKSLPKGWRYEELNNVILLNFGVRITQKNNGGTKYPVYGGGGESFRTDSYNRKNDYVIARFAMSEKCARYVKEKFFLLDSGLTFSLRQDESSDKDYIGYFLFCIQNKIYAKSRGQAQKNLDIKKFLEIKIPLPPLAKQKRIVAKLDKQLAVIEKARQAAEKQLSEATLLPATLLHTIFPINKKLPKDWRLIKLGEVCVINPKKGHLVRSDEQMTTFIPMASVSAKKGIITDYLIKAYKEIKKGYTYFQEGDVMFSKITPCMQNGKHFIAKKLIDKVGFASTEFHVLRPSNLIISEWIYFFVRQNHILKEATYHFTGTAGQQRVPDNFLKNLIIPLPPPAEQKRIVANMEKQLAAAEQFRLAAERQHAEINLMPAVLLRESITI